MSTATLHGFLVTAQRYDWDDHHDGASWVVMGVGMLVFWALVIALVVWLVRTLSHSHPGSPLHSASAPESPLDILDRRLAEGAISVEEYGERRRVLTGSPGPGAQ